MRSVPALRQSASNLASSLGHHRQRSAPIDWPLTHGLRPPVSATLSDCCKMSNLLIVT